MYTFDNANTSFKKAAANKRFHEEVLAFSMSKEDELFRACEELENLTYKQGEYTVFKVWEPKERLIMALPFYDRVVQHMIVNAIGPVPLYSRIAAIPGPSSIHTSIYTVGCLRRASLSPHGTHRNGYKTFVQIPALAPFCMPEMGLTFAAISTTRNIGKSEKHPSGG